MHAADREIRFTHLLRQPINLAFGVAEDDGLGDGQSDSEEKGVQPCSNRFVQEFVAPRNSRIVKIAKRIKLPILFLNRHKELLDPLQCQFITFHQDPDRIRHEFLSHFQDVVRECGGKDDHLSRRWEVPVNVVDLVLESFVEQFVGFIEDEHLNPVERRISSSSLINQFSQIGLTLMFLVRKCRRLIMSNTLPGVPDTTCCPYSNFLISSPKLVPPIHA